MITRKVISNLTCFPFLSLLLLHGGSAVAASPRVAITEIGYEVSEPVIYIAWVDNNQLLFVGQKSNPDPKKRSSAPGKMYIWNDSTMVVREYADATSFCYAEGWIRYGSGKKDEAGNRIVHAGPLGKKEIIKVSPSRPSGWRGSNKFSCKPYSLDDFVPPISTTRQHLVLREGDGYLTLRPNEHKEYVAYPRNITLYPEKGAKPVTLPITWDEKIGGVGTRYSEYLRVYVLPPEQFISSKGPGNWPPNEPRVVYLLHPDGMVQKVSFPPDSAFYRPSPVKSGWIYGGGSFYKTSGLYLFRDNAVRKLDSGNVKGIEVTPNGCKAAVAINNRHLDMGTPVVLKIFDFCVEGN